MVKLTPSTLAPASRTVTGSRLALYRAPFLIFLTGYLLLWLVCWFIVEIIIHSEPQASSDNTYYVQITLAAMSLQLFMYVATLTLAALALAWYADLQRTKAARAAAAMLGTFSKSVWLYTLWYSISTFYKGYGDLNWFCGGGAGGVAEFQGVSVGNKSDWCYLARTVAVLNVLIGAGLIALWVWCVINRFARITPEIPISTTVNVLPPHHKRGSNANNAAHNLDISWRTVLTYPDDLEQAFIAAAYPHLYGPARSRMNFLSKVGTTLLVFISIGTLLMTYPSIAYSKAQGLNAWSTDSYTDNTTANYVGWGDPIIAGNWYWLMLTLGASLAMTSYADGRTHRSFAAAAGCLSTLSTLQFLSFWVYSARRVNASAGSFLTLDLIDDEHSQFAEIAGAGVILACQLGISFTLLVRYFTYLPITPEHHAQYHHPAHIDAPYDIPVTRDSTAAPDTTHPKAADAFPTHATMHVGGPQRSRGGLQEVPSYNLPALHGVGWALRALIGCEVALVFVWWIVQVVGEADANVFSSPLKGQAYFFNERMFLLTSTLCTAAFLAAVYAERHREPSTVTAAAVVCGLLLAGFFLLVWPFAYQSVASSGYLRTSATQDELWGRLTVGSGVMALMQGFILLFIFLSSLFTMARVRWSATHRASSAAAIGGRLSALLSGWLVWLIAGFVAMWAAVTVAATVRPDYLGFFQQYQTIEVPSNAIFAGNIFTEGYWSSQAFLLLVLLVLCSWLAVHTLSPFVWQNRVMRILTCLSCAALAASVLPMLIFACRLGQTLSLSGDERTFVAVFILLPLLCIALFGVSLWRFVEPLYRHVPPPLSTDSCSVAPSAASSDVAWVSAESLQHPIHVVGIPQSLHTEETVVHGRLE